MLLVDEDQALYVGAVSSEGPPHVLKMALDGSRKEWDDGTWGHPDGLSGMARFGKVLCLNFGSSLKTRLVENGKDTWTVPELRRFAGKEFPNSNLLHAGDDPSKKKISPMSFAGDHGFLVVTYRDYDEVRILWPLDETGDGQKTVSVSKPGAWQ